MEDNRLAGSLELVELVGSLELVEQVDNHRADRKLVELDMLVEVDIQLWEELADQCETSAETEELPSVAVQTCHLVCPFQSCAVSAYMHRPCSTPSQPNNSTTEMPLRFLHFQQSSQLWRKYTQVVVGRT